MHNAHSTRVCISRFLLALFVNHNGLMGTGTRQNSLRTYVSGIEKQTKCEQLPSKHVVCVNYDCYAPLIKLEKHTFLDQQIFIKFQSERFS